MTESIPQEIIEEGELEKLAPQEREAAIALETAFQRFGTFASLSNKEDLTAATAQEKEEVQKIKSRAGKALQVFFKTLKISIGIGVLALVIGGPEGFDAALDAYAGKKAASSETDVLHKHPAIAKIAEWYFGQNLMETMDTYRRLAESRVDGHMSTEEIAFRERISNNVFPGTQGEIHRSDSRTTTELGRLKKQFQNLDKNTGRVSKEALEALPENDGYEKYIKQGTEVRSDMFRLYLGLSPHFDYVEDAPFKPTKAKNPDAHYKSFSARKIIDSIRTTGNDMKARGELADEVAQAYAATSFDALWAYTQSAKALPENAYTQSLGIYMVDQGYDSAKGERYISYYDIWDLDIKPFRLAGMNLDKYNFPFEVYGRIYESDLK